MSAHWVSPLTGPFWRCPKCNAVTSYGTRRSLWSLIPGVCIHRAQRWDERIKTFGWYSVEGVPLAFVDVGKTISLYEPKIVSFLRRRLAEELKGYRRFWWSGFTKEYKERRQVIRDGIDAALEADPTWSKP